jgi:hypothetical protein
MVRKKKLLGVKAKGANAIKSSKTARRVANTASKEERRARKLALRKREKNAYTADMWAQPAPSHLVARLDVPRVKSKYQSYFEFTANPEKKDKKLEFKAGLVVSPSSISTNSVIGHQRCRPTSRFRVCTYR